MNRKWLGLGLAICGLAAVGVSAQSSQRTEGGENPFAMPELRKYWNPVVGTGAIYEVTSADGKKKRTEEFDILSMETIAGKKAYWLEFSVESSVFRGKAYEKSLVIPAEFRAQKIVAQFPGMAAMEVRVGGAIIEPKADPNDVPKLLGTESIKVDAGTFECEHRREADGSEVWLSANVSPMKLVKSVDHNNETRVLVKIVSHPKDAITGPVKPYDAEAIKKFLGAESE